MAETTTTIAEDGQDARVARWHQEMKDNGRVVFRADGPPLPVLIGGGLLLALFVAFVGWQLIAGTLPQIVLNILGWGVILGMGALILLRDRVTRSLHTFVADEDGLHGDGVELIPWEAIAGADAVPSRNAEFLRIRCTDAWLKGTLDERNSVVRAVARVGAARNRLATTQLKFPLRDDADDVARFIVEQAADRHLGETR